MRKINNIKINKKTNEVVVNINTVFYNNDYILRATERFKDICWTKLKGDPEGCLSLSLKPKRKGEIDLNALGFEFMNHLLAEVKSEVN